jgi:hypothetical protein
MKRSQAAAHGHSDERSEFIDSLQKGMLLGAAVLLVVLPPKLIPFTSSAPQASAVRSVQVPWPPAIRLASFGGEEASADVRHIANWALTSGDTQNKAFVIVDRPH